MSILLPKEYIVFAFRVHFGVSIHTIRQNVKIAGLVYQRALLSWYLKELCGMDELHIEVYLGISKHRFKKDINVLRQECRIRPDKVKNDKSHLNQLIEL